MTDLLRVVFLGLFMIAFAVSAAAKNIAKCGSRQLSNKDCHLKRDKLAIHLFKDKIIVSDGIYRGMGDFPASGATVAWQAGQLKRLNGRDFLEIEVWDAPTGEVDVQSLVWHVYEIRSGEPIAITHKTVQKRRLIQSDPTSDNPKYKFDKSIDRKLFLQSKKIFWKVGREQGEIPLKRSSSEI